MVGATSSQVRNQERHRSVRSRHRRPLQPHLHRDIVAASCCRAQSHFTVQQWHALRVHRPGDAHFSGWQDIDILIRGGGARHHIHTGFDNIRHGRGISDDHDGKLRLRQGRQPCTIRELKSQVDLSTVRRVDTIHAEPAVCDGIGAVQQCHTGEVRHISRTGTGAQCNARRSNAGLLITDILDVSTEALAVGRDVGDGTTGVGIGAADKHGGHQRGRGVHHQSSRRHSGCLPGAVGRSDSGVHFPRSVGKHGRHVHSRRIQGCL